MTQKQNLRFHWHFLCADQFPLREALNGHTDSNGRFFYETEYQENGWKKVTLPHTFNDEDLFRDRIQDGGSGQKRTVSFYRKWIDLPKDAADGKVLIAFEGMRQTCYLYVNGVLAGYYEAGTAPFGFDLTQYLHFGEKNLLAIATDNTSTRNIPFCIAETPAQESSQPGTYLLEQDGSIPEGYHHGVGYFWNCNDFNPTIGGISRPVHLYLKPKMYLTLPLYSNLQTKGSYLYAADFDWSRKTAVITAEAEIRNETDQPKEAWIEVTVRGHRGETAAVFSSEKRVIAPVGEQTSAKTLVPEDAYIWDEASQQYVPQAEDQVSPTQTESMHTEILCAQSVQVPLDFWSIDHPYLYQAEISLMTEDGCIDREVIETGFTEIGYDKDRGVLLNQKAVWLRGYAQRAANEWAAIGIAPEWLKDEDAALIRESNANHIRFMHVAASPADIRSFDRNGIVCTQPAGDKERENFGRQWDQRVELMRDIIIAFRNHPSIVFWEAGNNSIGKEHMREMRLLKEALDPKRGRFMGCRTINTEEVLNESEYVGTMLNRHAARFLAEHGPITETEYLREEAPRRIWDDFTPPDYDYDNRWLGKGGRKQVGADFYDLTSEDLALASAKGYSEFFNDRIGGASHHDWYSACAALCWTDSAQHGRQSFSENGRMSGRVDAVRNKKQSFDIFRVMQSPSPEIKIVGHWNYPDDLPENYWYPEKQFNGNVWEKTGRMLRRDPRHKTVYVFGSYPIARIDLFLNGKPVGSCGKPDDTFVFAFPDIDITEHGTLSAVGYDFHGSVAAHDSLETAGKPARLEVTVHTSPAGLMADGQDVAYADLRVVDDRGRLCPLCGSRIRFELSGDGIFLGGYNSGRFAGYGKDDSVIHTDHIYAECGTGRVFWRSTMTAGEICLTAYMDGVLPVSFSVQSVPVRQDETDWAVPVSYRTDLFPETSGSQEIPAIEEADQLKYHPEDQLYCKVLINGQEPDTRGVRSVNKNGSIWGAVLCILDRLKNEWGHAFSYDYDETAKRLTLTSGGHTIIAEAGMTHLLADGKENLMDGEPYVVPENRQFVMEINAIVSYIEGITAWYDDKVNVFRIETHPERK